MKKSLVAILAVVVTIVVFQAFNNSSSEDSIEDNDYNYSEYFKKNYKIFGLNIPNKLDFCGEKVPINDFAVREALDRELLVNTYWQSQTLLFHKRANRWFPVIEPILKANGVPDDFKYLAVIESGLTNAVSPARATGYWQFMESTAKQFNLEVSKEVDERYSIQRSTEAACSYLKQSYQTFKNWTLVAASYNMGIQGLQNQLENQKTNNYYDLLLNSETSRYVFRILAIKEILSSPKDYGFILRKKDLYPPLPTKPVVVDTTINDLADFAIENGITYKLLKILNPWLRQNRLTIGENKNYTILLPGDLDFKYDSDTTSYISDSTVFYMANSNSSKREITKTDTSINSSLQGSGEAELGKNLVEQMHNNTLEE